MDDYFLSLRKHKKTFSYLRNCKCRFRGVGTKKRNILIAIILAIAASLFFSALFDEEARAQQAAREAEKLSSEIIDPMNRIGKGLIGSGTETTNSSHLGTYGKKEDVLAERDQNGDDGKIFQDLVQDHPISEMVPYIAKRDKKVAAFLIAIAKKESDWGKHSPKINGRDCFNYWGFKGGYKPTSSGYSCFDSPEQAISVVGDKIENLIGKKIDTPERMLVWKCGSSCKGHDPAGVRKWVSDVSGIFYKLTS